MTKTAKEAVAKPRQSSKGGRPTKYKAEFAEQARKLCLLGATDADLAEFFEVAESTINKWKKDHKAFSESIKKGKIDADANVAHSLYKRATGYEQDIVKAFQYQGEPVIVPLTEKVAPDTTAAIFWLKNRQKDRWRDKQDLEHSGPNGVPIQHEHKVTKAEIDDFISGF